LNVSEDSISDLTGVEAFVNLDTLVCNSNQQTTPDVSNCNALTSLISSSNQLTNLDVSNNTSLTGLEYSSN